MNQKTKINKKSKKKIEFEFCKVCNLNHDQGRNHKYFTKHRNSLSNFLSRFQVKLADIRFFLKSPTILLPELASRNRVWCVFCDVDIDEIGSSFACAHAISHLASEEHLKNLKHFMWKYGGGMDRVDSFRILEADVAKWEKKCEALRNEATVPSSDGLGEVQVGLTNDIRNDCNNENINNFENNNFATLNSNVSNGVKPLQYSTYEYQISNSGFSAFTNVGPGIYGSFPTLPVDTCSGTSSCGSNNNFPGNWNSQHFVPRNSITCAPNLSNGEFYQGETILHGAARVHVPAAAPQMAEATQVPVMTLQMAGGNVHTGAPPPWFAEAEENQKDLQLKPICSRSFSIANKSGKSCKLNPKRVGAAWAERRKMEMEMEKRGEIVKTDFDANWLPNFGRVWQSGSRKESRKEFEKEKQKLSNMDSHTEMPIVIQPYISKRMRREAGE